MKRIKILTPEQVEFEGTLNDLQNAYTETRRMRINAETRLSEMKESDDPISYHISAAFVNICMDWEEKLEADLKERIPKEQSQLFGE